MKRFLAILSALLIAAAAPALAEQYSGTWTLEHGSDAGMVQLGLRYQHRTAGGNEEWDESRSVAWSELRGISEGDLDSNGVQKSFSIVHDAGSFQAQGTLRGGHGGGIWTFAPSAGFNAELGRRGIGAPDAHQQFELAMADFKMATLDQLLASGFARPSVGDLVSMIEHGVTDKYIQEMRGLGLHPNSAQALIRMRDHGVGGDFAATVMHAYPGTTVDELVEMRDHGVGTSYIQELAKLGLHVSASDLISLRDHGVGTSYIDEIQRLGLRVSTSDLIRLRDHGVSASFIERLRSHGYTKLSVDDLIRLRDSGF